MRCNVGGRVEIGMRSRRKIQYTIRNVPVEVDRRLRDSARRLHRSLNQTLLDLLSRASGKPQAPTSYRDLDSFFGSWTADQQVDQALAEQRKVSARHRDPRHPTRYPR